MPKHELFHKAGEPISLEIKHIIEKYFTNKEAQKLERLGGRILISVSAPYKTKTKEQISINELFIDKIKSKQNDTVELRNTLDKLSINQLREICFLLNQPVRSNAVAEEIKREIIRNLQSEEYWQRISNTEHNAANTADAKDRAAD
jgi:hypothetical protein